MVSKPGTSGWESWTVTRILLAKSGSPLTWADDLCVAAEGAGGLPAHCFYPWTWAPISIARAAEDGPQEAIRDLSGRFPGYGQAQGLVDPARTSETI